MDWSSLKWDAAGLVTVVVQDRFSGEVRMVGHADRAALQATIETGQAHFYSRSRQALWRKGETSGHTLDVDELWLDCDRDAVLYLAEPAGPTCHTGKPSCFFSPLGDGPSVSSRGRITALAEASAGPTWVRLWSVLDARRHAAGDRSYTRKLLDGGAERIGAKLREEAGELANAVAAESPERVVSEAADVVYHTMVALIQRGVSWRDVARELDRRFGTSGLEEKAARARRSGG